jgi:hypothetical protein
MASLSKPQLIALSVTGLVVAAGLTIWQLRGGGTPPALDPNGTWSFDSGAWTTTKAEVPPFAAEAVEKLTKSPVSISLNGGEAVISSAGAEHRTPYTVQTSAPGMVAVSLTKPDPTFGARLSLQANNGQVLLRWGSGNVMPVKR